MNVLRIGHRNLIHEFLGYILTSFLMEMGKSSRVYNGLKLEILFTQILPRAAMKESNVPKIKSI